MSLVVPITTGQMMAGAQAYQPGAEGPTPTAVAASLPSINASAGGASNNISFAVAGWIALGVVGLLLIDHLGFKVVHVP